MQLDQDTYSGHEYLNEFKASDELYKKLVEFYKAKYSIQ